MKIDIKNNCAGVDWIAVSETLKCVGMAYHKPDVHRRTFEASHTTVFIYHTDQLIGFGRAISDGVYQKHGFRKMKTGMAHFKKSAVMREGGFTE